jgi:hypothetical protein
VRQVPIGAVGAFRTIRAIRAIIVGTFGSLRGAARTLIEAAAIATAAATAAAAAAAALALATRGLVETGHGGGIEHFRLGASGPRGHGGRMVEIGHRIGGDQLGLSGLRGCARLGGGSCCGMVEGLGERGGVAGGSELFADSGDRRLERLDELVLPQSAPVVDLMLARQLA